MKNANEMKVVSVESCASGIVSAYETSAKAVSVGATVAKAIAELFVDAEATGRFDEVFGNGLRGKMNKPGELKIAIDAKCVRMSKEKREGIAAMLKVRLSEARRLHKLEGVPQKGEDVQAALKRYAKTPERNAKPEGNTKDGKFVIPEELTHEQLAEAFSVWMAAQSAAKIKAIAADLKEMLTPARTRTPKAKQA